MNTLGFILTSVEISHMPSVCPGCILAHRGALAASWLVSGLDLAQPDRVCPTCPLGSQPLELDFHVLLIVSQGHILLSTCVLSKIKENLIYLNMPWGLHLTKANVVNFLDSPFLCQRIQSPIKTHLKNKLHPM